MKIMYSKFIIIALASLSLNTFGQKWTFKAGGNAFDGRYKTASIIGISGSTPFNTPLLVVNYFENGDDINIYIADAGYAGCDNKLVMASFDKEKNIYSFSGSTNANRDIWFFEENEENKSENISKLELLEKIKKNNKLFVRIVSQCNQGDIEFSLNGSSQAIDFVLNEYLKTQQMKEEENRQKEFEKQQVINLISQGNPLIATAKYNASILFEPKSSSFYKHKTIKEGEEFVFTFYPQNTEFYIINKSESHILSADSTFYISKSAVNISSVKVLE